MLQRAGLALAAVVGLTAAPGLVPLAAQDVPYRVVVHVSNPVSRLTREQVSQIFLRKVALWDNRQPVLPVDQPPDSPVRRAFTKQVHRRTVALVRTYWQQQTFAGRAVPPPERGSDARVLAYIRQYPNAIGYVHADTDLGTDIKVVIVTP
ncbi:MAG TPA: substrate-binding domain-containing protein [Gemmatimonadales bacterium]|nr:substrate-binding domain-containing protein [Gemmatimonadales bacterium]